MEKQMEKRIILASASPRRRELLAQMGLSFEVMPSTKEEKMIEAEASKVVESLSAQKAEDIAQQINGDATIIGSDTIVVCDGKIMGKPHSKEEAFSMISRLQGRKHQVYTGVTVIDRINGKEAKKTFAAQADVSVYPMTDAEIEAYIAKGESMDKAGAYGIQGAFGMFVKEIKGEYTTILGLPIAALYQTLKELRA